MSCKSFKRIWNWFNKARLSVLTSEREGFPYAAIESLFCGVPVIATKCGDINDLIKDGYNGVLINNHRNVDLLSKEIVNLLHKPQQIKMFSEHARKISNNITIEKITSIWKELINKTQN